MQHSAQQMTVLPTYAEQPAASKCCMVRMCTSPSPRSVPAAPFQWAPCCSRQSMPAVSTTTDLQSCAQHHCAFLSSSAVPGFMGCNQSSTAPESYPSMPGPQLTEKRAKTPGLHPAQNLCKPQEETAAGVLVLFSRIGFPVQAVQPDSDREWGPISAPRIPLKRHGAGQWGPMGPSSSSLGEPPCR